MEGLSAAGHLKCRNSLCSFFLSFLTVSLFPSISLTSLSPPPFPLLSLPSSLSTSLFPLLPLSYFRLVTQHSPSKAPPCSLTLKRNQYAFMSFGRSGTSAAVFPLQFSLTVSLHVLRQRRKTRGNEACVLDQLTALSKLLKAQRLLPYLSLNKHYTL